MNPWNTRNIETLSHPVQPPVWLRVRNGFLRPRYIDYNGINNALEKNPNGLWMRYLIIRICFFLRSKSRWRLTGFSRLIRLTDARFKYAGALGLAIRLMVDLLPLEMRPRKLCLKLWSGGSGFLKSENSFLCDLLNGLESARYGELLLLKLRPECSKSSYDLRGDAPCTTKHICKRHLHKLSYLFR